jgi:hypothetical protein
VRLRDDISAPLAADTYARALASIHPNLEAVNMWVVGVGLILNLVASVAVFSYLLHQVGVQQAAWFFATFLVTWAFLIIGFIMQVAGKRKGGAVLITIGSIVFIPVGLVSIVGSILIARRRDRAPN